MPFPIVNALFFSLGVGKEWLNSVQCSSLLISNKEFGTESKLANWGHFVFYTFTEMNGTVYSSIWTAMTSYVSTHYRVSCYPLEK